MGKREMIERALGKYIAKLHQSPRPYVDDFYDALAKQAIVIECEVEHYCVELANPAVSILGTIDDAPVDAWIKVPKTRVGRYYLDGHIGTPGKGLAIIVPLEEEDDSV